MLTTRIQMVAPAVASRVTGTGVNALTHVTVHETANATRGANAQAHANLQAKGNSRNASWHWQVDDREAIQSFRETVQCFHAGNPRGNATSVGVEICVNADGDWRRTVENAAELVAQIARRHGIPLSRIVQHNHWSGKNCPTRLRAGTGGIDWAAFLARVSRHLTPTTPIKTTKTEPTEEDPAMQIITAPGRGQALINTSAIPAYVPLATPAETQAAGKLAWHKTADLVQLTDSEFDAVATFLKRGA